MDGHRLEFIYYLRKKTGSYILNTYNQPPSRKAEWIIFYEKRVLSEWFRDR